MVLCTNLNLKQSNSIDSRSLGAFSPLFYLGIQNKLIFPLLISSSFIINTNIIFMASTFYIVHHEFKAGKAEKWWETAYAAMSPGGGWDDAVAANKEKGFFNHSANAVTKTGPVYCFWEVKEGISAEDFQEFIDGPSGPGFGQDALMNICKPIDTSLMNGQTPYPPVFS